MKILLINPSQRAAYGDFTDVPTFFPIGLGYLGAVLEKKGHNAALIDIDAQKVSDQDLKETLTRGGYGLVGITATSPTVNSAFRLAGFIKSVIDAPIVFGGVHPTLFPDHPFGCEDVDFVVRGEGEETLSELVDALERRRPLKEVLGLSFRDSGYIAHNPPRPLIKDLDGLPFPLMHKMNEKLYSYPNSLKKRIAPILTSRGCPGQCTFCCTNKTFGNRIRYRSARNVVDELIYLKDNFGTEEIHVWDDNFITNKKFIAELKGLMKAEGLSFKVCLVNGVRVDFFTEEVAFHLKEIGVYSVAFGIESGNQAVLDGVKKGIKLEASAKAVAMAKKFGFETWGFFMLGLPGDDKKTVADTIKFSIKLDPDIAKFHLFKPFPGTEAYETLRDNGCLLSYDFDRYGIYSRPVHRLKDLTEDDMVASQKAAYRAFYFRPRKILSQVLNLRTFERTKFMAKGVFNMLKILRGDV